ncbi:MAG: EAL domain-containing protein [Cellulomonas sp.]
MTWQWSSGGLLTVLAAGAFGVLATLVWRRRVGTATLWLGLVLLATGIWSLAYTLELVSPTAPARHLWGDLKYVGICALPPAWVAFTLVYTGADTRLRRRILPLLAVEPLLVLALLSNAQTRDLIRYYPGGPTSDLAVGGILFWPHSIYTYLLLWGATTFLVVRLVRISPVYRVLSVVLVLSFALPFVLNVLFNAGIEPFDMVDLTPFAFLLSGLVLVWGVLRYGLVRLQPVGRSEVFMTIRDLVITLDPLGYVIDANPAAAAVLELPADQIIGRQLDSLIPGATLPSASGGDEGAGGSPRRRVVINNRRYETENFRLSDRHHRPLGTLVMARDITDREFAEQALARSTAEFVAAFEYAPEGMALIGSDRRILNANRALSEISGYPVGDLLALTLEEFLDEPESSVEAEGLAETIAGHRDESRCELTIVRADGARRWVSVSAARIGAQGSVNHAVLHVEDITDRKGYERRLLHLANHDPLTGLANRRRFREDLERYLTLANRARVGGALILLDLDHFKDINDTLGHPAGDALLSATADALRGRVREADLIARVGGDEFAVLLWAVDLSEATVLAEEVLETVRSAGVDHDGKRVRTTVSAGLVMLDGAGTVTADEVISNADLAMYEAKEHGRDRLVVYEPAGPAAAQSRARFHWTEQIRRALDEDRFMLLSQPILDLASGHVTGCELLLRMRLGEELIEPDEFLEIADRHGLAVAIDRRVVRLGTDLAARYRQPPGFRWEINISAASLGDATLFEVIETELAAKDLAPQSLVFEITETAAITNVARAREFAARVSGLGCGFALDDFGAGYGSFYYLKHLPCDYLKIDGEFIRDLQTNQTNQVIVQALVSAARGLRKQTIAEYVTDRNTLNLVRAYGVDHAQGYFVGRPSDPATSFPMRSPAGAGGLDPQSSPSG